jgi:hypothetical protein
MYFTLHNIDNKMLFDDERIEIPRELISSLPKKVTLTPQGCVSYESSVAEESGGYWPFSIFDRKEELEDYLHSRNPYNAIFSRKEIDNIFTKFGPSKDKGSFFLSFAKVIDELWKDGNTVLVIH